ARTQSRPPSLDVRWWFVLLRPELQLELPFAPSRWHTYAARGLRIDRVARRPDSVTAVVVETRPVFISTLLRQSARENSAFYRFFPESDRTLLAMNGERREVRTLFTD